MFDTLPDTSTIINMSQHVATVFFVSDSNASTTECCPSPFDATLTPDDAAALAERLKVLADPVRLQLISIIAASEQGETCACDLPVAVDRSQPTVSHHLRLLTEAGAIEREQRGKWAWFRLSPTWFTTITQALTAIKPN